MVCLTVVIGRIHLMVNDLTPEVTSLICILYLLMCRLSQNIIILNAKYWYVKLGTYYATRVAIYFFTLSVPVL